MDHSGLTEKQFVDANKIRDFFTKIANSFSRSKNEVVTSFLRIFTNSFTRTSFLFAELRIHSYEFVRFSACYVANGCTVDSAPLCNFPI